MLPLHIASWTADRAVFHATEPTWRVILARLKSLPHPPARAIAIIEQELPSADVIAPERPVPLRSLALPMPEAEIVYVCARAANRDEPTHAPD